MTLAPPSPKPRRAAVIGWPVSHSLSPLIHLTWAAREGANVQYDRIAIEPDDEIFRQRINALRGEGLAGVNVTIPHKERALALADRASPAARAIGAANMLTFAPAGIEADNSDAMAIEAIVRAISPAPSAALVLGAGGAARAALFALNAAGISAIEIANRTRARAEAIAPIGGARVTDWALRNDALARADLVINATSLGMTGAPPLDLDHHRLKAGAVIFEIVYSPLETPLLAAARASGLQTIDGLEMLMRQAAPAYLRWLGARAAIDADLRARLEAALAARAR